MGAVHHQRRADDAAGHGLLQGAVGAVVAAHEADLDQPLAVRHLGLEDAQAGLLRGRQRLLAEDRLSGRDAGEHIFLVGRAPGGDDDRVDPVVADQLLARREGAGTGQLRATPARGPIDVGDRDDRGPRQHLGQAADVVLADHADADHADLQHFRSLHVTPSSICRRISASPGA